MFMLLKTLKTLNSVNNRLPVTSNSKRPIVKRLQSGTYHHVLIILRHIMDILCRFIIIMYHSAASMETGIKLQHVHCTAIVLRNYVSSSYDHTDSKFLC